jgi:hypothetical protein
MSMRSQATKAASDRNATQEARQAARDIRDELDNALEATMPEGQRKAYGVGKRNTARSRKFSMRARARGLRSGGRLRQDVEQAGAIGAAH